MSVINTSEKHIWCDIPVIFGMRVHTGTHKTLLRFEKYVRYMVEELQLLKKHQD